MSNKTKIEHDGVIKSWRTIIGVLHSLGYDFMYQDDIDNVANFIRKELVEE